MFEIFSLMQQLVRQQSPKSDLKSLKGLKQLFEVEPQTIVWKYDLNPLTVFCNLVWSLNSSQRAGLMCKKVVHIYSSEVKPLKNQRITKNFILKGGKLLHPPPLTIKVFFPPFEYHSHRSNFILTSIKNLFISFTLTYSLMILTLNKFLITFDHFKIDSL